MTIKRSYFHFLMGSAAVALFLANCTVKESQDDSCSKGDVAQCDCSNGKGHQECNSKGFFGDCICPDEASNAGTGNTSTAGKAGGNEAGTSNGGTTYGGNGGTGNTSTAGDGNVAAANAGGASDGGAGGDGNQVVEYTDCESCLADKCSKEWDACNADPNCLDENGEGQYADISTCVEIERQNGLVKRDALRACGVTIGGCNRNGGTCASDPSIAADVWAPNTMAASTTNLLNCLASSSSAKPDAKWANDPANYDPKITAWPEDSCAKLACTSGE